MQIDKVSTNTNYYILDTIITIIISKEEINKSNATREGNFREGEECRLFSRVSWQPSQILGRQPFEMRVKRHE